MSFLKDLGSALTFGATDLIGSGLGLISNNQTNKTNMKINQMNNEFNERMMDKQIAYEQEMWQKNNEYNSASAQAQRWRDAGFNPTLMMQNGNAGVASSGSVSQASAASPVAMQSYTPNVSGFIDVMTTLMNNVRQAKVDEANIDFLGAQSDYLRAKGLQEVEGLRLQNEWYPTMKQKEYDHLNSQIGYNRSLQSYNYALEDYQLLVNEKVPEELSARIAMLRAQTGHYEFMSKTQLGQMINEYEKQFGKLPESAKKIIYSLDKLGEFGGKVLSLRRSSHKHMTTR